MLGGLEKHATVAGRFLIFLISNIYGTSAYIMWLLLLFPLRYLAPALHWRLESLLFHIAHCLVLTWLRGYKVLECGEDVSQLSQEECLVLCNHQSTADTGILMLAFYHKRTTPVWVMWSMFKYTHFGFMSNLRKDLFVEVGREKREQELENMKKHLEIHFVANLRKWIIVYPEGGFWHKRIEGSQRYAARNGYPVLKHVTLPRLGVVSAILDTLGVAPKDPQEPRGSSSMENGVENFVEPLVTDPKKPIKYVIDVTLAYADQSDPHDMLGLCLGTRPKTDIMVHYRVLPVDAIPRDEKGLTGWLYDLYQSKDKMMENFYAHGKVTPDMLSSQSFLPSLKSSYVRFDPMQQLLTHGFLMLSFYVHWVYVYKPIFALVSQVLGLFFFWM